MADHSTRNRRAGSTRKPGARHVGAPTVERGKRSLEVTLPRFVQHYMGDCHQNATTAALAIGAKRASAHNMGYRLLKQARESGLLAEAARAVAHKVELQTEETLLELRRILTSDPRRYYTADGSVVPPGDWDADMAAAVASVEMDHVVVRTGKRSKVVPVVAKIKFWSKTDAVNIAMKHQGLFERDNRQRQTNLALQINLVGSPAPAEPRSTD
jgi:phage terminase small subunit